MNQTFVRYLRVAVQTDQLLFAVSTNCFRKSWKIFNFADFYATEASTKVYKVKEEEVAEEKWFKKFSEGHAGEPRSDRRLKVNTEAICRSESDHQYMQIVD